MPADLGTKPLSFEKFAKFKDMMGMCTEEKLKKEDQKKEEENQEVKALRVVSATSSADIKRALTAVLLIAQAAMSKAQGEEETGYYDWDSAASLLCWTEGCRKPKCFAFPLFHI
eukprot:s676_g17.t1